MSDTRDCKCTRSIGHRKHSTCPVGRPFYSGFFAKIALCQVTCSSQRSWPSVVKIFFKISIPAQNAFLIGPRVSWAFAIFFSLVGCAEPPRPANGMLRDGYKDTAGSLINQSFVCNDDYHIVGSSVAFCQYNGTWTDFPTCEGSVCPSLLHGLSRFLFTSPCIFPLAAAFAGFVFTVLRQPRKLCSHKAWKFCVTAYSKCLAAPSNCLQWNSVFTYPPGIWKRYVLNEVRFKYVLTKTKKGQTIPIGEVRDRQRERKKRVCVLSRVSLYLILTNLGLTLCLTTGTKPHAASI